MAAAVLALTLAGVAQAQTAAADSPRPVPRNSPQRWMTNDDYPAGPLKRREWGSVSVSLDVDTAGAGSACKVTGSSGFWELDEAACALLLRNARFSPARDAEGKPVASTFATRMSWGMPGTMAPSGFTDARQGLLVPLTVTVEQLPVGYRQPARVRLRYGPDGAAIDCRLVDSSGHAGIDRVACAQARESVPRPPRTDEGTHPDAAVAVVTFEADGGEK